MATESKWAAFRSIGYLCGKGLIYCADYEIFPQAAITGGVFPLYADENKHCRVDVCDTNLEVLADGMLDYVFIGPRLEGVEDPEARLREATKKLRVGGHLILHLPLAPSSEVIVHRFTPKTMRGLVGSLGSWIAKDSYERCGTFLQIYKKVRGARGVANRKTTAQPRACIVRYGAMGDMIMVTPLIRALHEDGYHVTVNCTRYSSAILDNNPFVDNVILQEREAIPNHLLGDYWAEWCGDYDKYINLSESIEGALLKVEGRREFYTSLAWRNREAEGVNYFDRTLALGGYPERVGCRGELYFSGDEERAARKFRAQYGNKFIVLWALNGSSHHKCYGLFEPVVTDWLNAHPEALVVTVGDHTASLLEFEHPQLVPKAGVWPIRQSLCMTKYVDLVVGPESVITNAAGCFDTPKIVLLSHSGHDNLCKYWTNCVSLAPDLELAPCYGTSGCHQLHYFAKSCVLKQLLNPDGTVLTELPACALAISGERLIAAFDEQLAKSKTTVAAV
jgi:hypothetical protein